MRRSPQKAGELWNSFEAPGEKMQAEADGEIIKLSADEMAEFDKLDQQVVDRWIEEATKNGIDGKALVDAAKAAVLKHSQ